MERVDIKPCPCPLSCVRRLSGSTRRVSSNSPQSCRALATSAASYWSWSPRWTTMFTRRFTRCSPTHAFKRSGKVCWLIFLFFTLSSVAKKERKRGCWLTLWVCTSTSTYGQRLCLLLLLFIVKGSFKIHVHRTFLGGRGGGDKNVLKNRH